MDPLHKALAEIQSIVGEAFVKTHPEEIAELSRVTIPTAKLPSAFVYPASVQDIQRIVAIAGRYQIPLWPCSKGRNWGYGSATPYLEHSVVLVLERMNRILEVNEELAYAVIEPGVTYRQLNEYLKAKSSRLWCDCTDGPPDGSVLGNALERGVGETPYGDHFGNVCGMEVVLPNGELIHTGGGPMPGCQTWHTHKWGIGPYLEGLFSQSNFGIVTKIGMWLMPEPEAFQAVIFDLEQQENFPQVIDAIRHLALQGILRTKLHMINDVVTFAVLTQYRSEDLPADPHLAAETLDRLRRKYAVAPWSFCTGLYGTAAEVRVHRRILKHTLGPYGRLNFLTAAKIKFVQTWLGWFYKTEAQRVLPTLPDRITRWLFGISLPLLEAAPHVYGILQGIPTEYFVRHAYFKCLLPKPDTDVHPARDGCGLIWFAPIVPLTSTHVTQFLAAAEPLIHKQEFDFYVALLLMNARSIIPLMAILYRKDDPQETRRAGELYTQLCAMAAASGYQQYRSGIPSWEGVFEHVPEFQTLCNTLKGALDPYNIMAPGKYGIGLPCHVSQ